MAKEMKRVLRENTTVDTQTGEVLKRETTVQFSKEPGFVKLYFDCLWRIHQERWSFSFAE